MKQLSLLLLTILFVGCGQPLQLGTPTPVSVESQPQEQPRLTPTTVGVFVIARRVDDTPTPTDVSVVQPTSTPEPLGPVTIEIPKIKFRHDTRRMGFNTDTWSLPAPLQDIVHYDATGYPGQGGNQAYWGHLTTLFKRLNELQDGDEIILESGGQKFIYTVHFVLTVEPTEDEYIYNGDYLSDSRLPEGVIGERVTLVTCDGDLIRSGGLVVDSTKRRVVIALRDYEKEHTLGIR